RRVSAIPMSAAPARASGWPRRRVRAREQRQRARRGPAGMTRARGEYTARKSEVRSQKSEDFRLQTSDFRVETSKRPSFGRQARFESVRAIAFAAGPWFGAVRITAAAPCVRVLDFVEREVFLPVRPL